MSTESAIIIAARGTLTNDAHGMLDRNTRTYTHTDSLWGDDSIDLVFAADGDIHVADREVALISCRDQADLVWWLEVGFMHADHHRPL